MSDSASCESEYRVNGAEARSSLEPIKLELLAVSIKVLELFQLEVLAKEEIKAMNGFTANQSSGFQLQEIRDAKQTALRICLYYETAIQQSLSIFDISARVTSSILKLVNGLEIQTLTFEEQLASTLIPEADPTLAAFLASLAPYHDRLVEDCKNALLDVAEVLGDDNEQDRNHGVLQTSSLSVSDLETRIAEICMLVRKYSNFLGEHFTRLL